MKNWFGPWIGFDDMNRIYKVAISFVFILTVSACEREIYEPSECYVSPETDSLYRLDAYRLLFQEIFNDSMHADRHSPRFNETEVLKILHAFQAVSDLDVAQRDTVFDVYNIHVFPFYGLHSISLKVDTSSQEIQKLVDGQATGNDQLDNLFTQYSFDQVSTSMFYPDFNWITITSDSAWNLLPLWETLKMFEFIYDAGMGDYAVGDGNTIVLERKPNSLLLDFSIGWGDCPSGCIYRKHWRFDVSDVCVARFRDESIQ